jgi:hypothetical protein
MVVGSERLEFSPECRMIPERAVKIRPARIPSEPARIADDLIGDGVHGIGHALHDLKSKPHY